MMRREMFFVRKIIHHIEPYLPFDIPATGAGFRMMHLLLFSSLQGWINLLQRLLLNDKFNILQKKLPWLKRCFIEKTHLKFLAFYLRPPTVTSWKNKKGNLTLSCKKLSTYANVCFVVCFKTETNSHPWKWFEIFTKLRSA